MFTAVTPPIPVSVSKPGTKPIYNPSRDVTSELLHLMSSILSISLINIEVIVIGLAFSKLGIVYWSSFEMKSYLVLKWHDLLLSWGYIK